ncbi:MAG: mandelate racemase/muconate lactonizing enzyme family protein [Anaerolineales bacterium]|nr:mandelate racemase/muconate lactonizing enzyme family protein [Anaerolineales bacterium]
MTTAIDSIEIHHFRLPLDPPFYASWDPNPRHSHTSTIVRVTAGDFEGVGSGDAMLGFAGHEHLFIGQDPFAIERHVRILDNLQFHYGRMWPLEVALWDLMGKIAGQPLWKLLGGLRNQVKPYASTGERIDADARAESAVRLQEMGFEALKLRFHAEDPRHDLAIVRAVRDAVGREMRLMVDANQGWQMPWDSRPTWDFKSALWMADALAELDCFWLEEPLHRHDYQGLAALRQRAKLRIAGGEGNREYSELREYLQHGSLDVYQPDVVWSTGIWRARQLAQEVQREGALYSPHTWGDGLVFLANLHVAAAVSDTPYLEFPFDPPNWSAERRDFILPHPFMPDADGYLTLGDEPGLGVEIDWQALEPLRIHTGTMEG